MRILLSSRGVRAVERCEEQATLWPGVCPEPPDLKNLGAYGARLAHELDTVFAGRPVEFQVPWVPQRPAWIVQLYRRVCELPPGETAEFVCPIELDGKYRNERLIAGALRRCPLVPLVPLHRVTGSQAYPIRFPWGEAWRAFLLRQEGRAMKERCGPGYPQATSPGGATTQRRAAAPMPAEEGRTT